MKNYLIAVKGIMFDEEIGLEGYFDTDKNKDNLRYGRLKHGDLLAIDPCGNSTVIERRMTRRIDEFPKVPSYIASFIEINENMNDVYWAIENASDYPMVLDWIKRHGDTFARAYLDGYEEED